MKNRPKKKRWNRGGTLLRPCFFIFLARTTFVLVYLPEAKNSGQDAILYFLSNFGRFTYFFVEFERCSYFFVIFWEIVGKDAILGDLGGIFGVNFYF